MYVRQSQEQMEKLKHKLFMDYFNEKEKLQESLRQNKDYSE